MLDNEYTAEIELMLSSAIAEITAKAEKPASKMKSRLEAIQMTYRQVLFYLNNYYDPKIVKVIFQKKIDAIMAAETIAELKEIPYLPKPVYYAGGFIDHHKYRFDEEELLQWCKASLSAPPGAAVAKRVDVLFERVYGTTFENFKR